MKVIIINGPNLNLLGVREKSIYGDITFNQYLNQIKNKYSNIYVEYYQSNIEGEIINKLHEIGFSYNFIILNAGGYTHTSVAISDAIASIKTPVIEVHISNIYSREKIRRKSLLSSECKAVICGLGLESYTAALSYISDSEKNL
jgi:3-dehydroquinate dehydratase-2